MHIGNEINLQPARIPSTGVQNRAPGVLRQTHEDYGAFRAVDLSRPNETRRLRAELEIKIVAKHVSCSIRRMP
jgi:hypothetical protein